MADTKLADLTASSGLAATDLFYTVKDPAGTPLDRKLTGAQLKAFANPVLARFLPNERCGPATAYATSGTMVGASTPAESVPVLNFDDTNVEYVDFYGYLPVSYGGDGVTVVIVWSAAQNINNGIWAAAFRRVADDAEDLDTTAQTYDFNSTTDIFPPDTVGKVTHDVITFDDGADMDSLAAGEYFILRVRRPAPVGTKVTGDCSIHEIVILEGYPAAVAEARAAAVSFIASDGCTQPVYGCAKGPSSIYVAATDTSWHSWQAWNGSARTAKVATYNHATQVWSSDVTVTTNVDANDDHGVPVLVRDHEGYIHLFCDGGLVVGSTTQHLTTTSPDDPSAWTSRTGLEAPNTYPNAIAYDSKLFVFFRREPATVGSVYVTTSLSGGVTSWAARKIIVDYGGTNNFYHGDCVTLNGEVYIMSFIALAGDTTGRRGIYCFVYNMTTGSIRNLAGTTTVLAADQPILLASANANFRLVEQATTFTSFPAACFNNAGTILHIVYPESTAYTGAPYVFKYINWNGSTLSSPIDIGASDLKSRVNFASVVNTANDNLEVYFTECPGNDFTAMGNVMRRTRSPAGVWDTAVAVLKPQSAHTFGYCSAVFGQDADGKVSVIFSERADSSLDPPASDGGDLKVFVYGNGAFVPR